MEMTADEKQELIANVLMDESGFEAITERTIQNSAEAGEPRAIKWWHVAGRILSELEK